MSGVHRTTVIVEPPTTSGDDELPPIPDSPNRRNSANAPATVTNTGAGAGTDSGSSSSAPPPAVHVPAISTARASISAITAVPPTPAAGSGAAAAATPASNNSTPNSHHSLSHSPSDTPLSPTLSIDGNTQPNSPPAAAAAAATTSSADATASAGVHASGNGSGAHHTRVVSANFLNDDPFAFLTSDTQPAMTTVFEFVDTHTEPATAVGVDTTAATAAAATATAPAPAATPAATESVAATSVAAAPAPAPAPAIVTTESATAAPAASQSLTIVTTPASPSAAAAAPAKDDTSAVISGGKSKQMLVSGGMESRLARTGSQGNLTTPKDAVSSSGSTGSSAGAATSPSSAAGATPTGAAAAAAAEKKKKALPSTPAPKSPAPVKAATDTKTAAATTTATAAPAPATATATATASAASTTSAGASASAKPASGGATVIGRARTPSASEADLLHKTIREWKSGGETDAATITDLISTHRSLVNRQDKEGMSPLMVSVSLGHVLWVSRLIDGNLVAGIQRARVNMQNNSGETALFIACRRSATGNSVSPPASPRASAGVSASATAPAAADAKPAEAAGDAKSADGKASDGADAKAAAASDQPLTVYGQIVARLVHAGADLLLKDKAGKLPIETTADPEIKLILSKRMDELKKLEEERKKNLNALHLNHVTASHAPAAHAPAAASTPKGGGVNAGGGGFSAGAGLAGANETKVADSELTLEDIFGIPQYCLPLRKYMEENFCSESFNFLWSSVAYRRLTTRDQRMELAPILYQEFVLPNGAQVVNIDSKTRQLVRDAFESEDYSPDMFVPAMRMVFAMCDSDIFRRFVLSFQYKAMLQDPVSVESLALRTHHRRRHSFSIVPMEEEYALLKEIVDKFTISETVKDRLYRLKKYPLAFRGCKLVDWLITNDYAKNRPAGIAIGQRLYDNNYIRHVVSGLTEFDDRDLMYTLRPKEALLKCPSAKVTINAEGEHQAGWLLLKGVYYQRVYVVINIEQRLCYIYSSPSAQHPRMRLHLKGATFMVIHNERAADREKTGMNKEAAAKVKDQKAPSARDNPMAYLHLDTETRSLVFRLDVGLEDAVTWPSSLQKCAVVERTNDKKEDALSLRDIYGCPQYNVVFRKYMEDLYSSDLYSFLFCCQAYKRLSTREQRADAAAVMYEEFLAPTARQRVDIEAPIRAGVLKDIERDEWKPDLFDVPFELVYRTLSEGQFKRFQQSMSYLKMLADPAATEAVALRDGHRRRHSFMLVPMEEEYRFLGEIMHKLARSDVPKDKRYTLKLYKESFKGNRLVDWFLEVGFAKNRPSAIALGQRLYDFGLIRHIVESASEFEDTQQAIYTMSHSVVESPSAKQILTQEGEHQAGWLLMKGVYYQRVFVVIAVEMKAMFIYASKEAPAARLKLKLKGASYTVFHHEKYGKVADPMTYNPPTPQTHAAYTGRQSVIAHSEFVPSLTPRASAPATGAMTSAANSAAAAAAAAAASPRMKGPGPAIDIAYLQLDLADKHSYCFRLDINLEDHINFPSYLLKSGCTTVSPLERQETRRRISVGGVIPKGATGDGKRSATTSAGTGTAAGTATAAAPAKSDTKTASQPVKGSLNANKAKAGTDSPAATPKGSSSSGSSSVNGTPKAADSKTAASSKTDTKKMDSKTDSKADPKSKSAADSKSTAAAAKPASADTKSSPAKSTDKAATDKTVSKPAEKSDSKSTPAATPAATKATAKSDSKATATAAATTKPADKPADTTATAATSSPAKTTPATAATAAAAAATAASSGATVSSAVAPPPSKKANVPRPSMSGIGGTPPPIDRSTKPQTRGASASVAVRPSSLPPPTASPRAALKVPNAAPASASPAKPASSTDSKPASTASTAAADSKPATAESKESKPATSPEAAPATTAAATPSPAPAAAVESTPASPAPALLPASSAEATAAAPESALSAGVPDLESTANSDSKAAPVPSAAETTPAPASAAEAAPATSTAPAELTAAASNTEATSNSMAAPAPAAAGGMELTIQVPPAGSAAPPSASSPTSTFRPRPLASQKSSMFADRERAVLRAEFDRFDADRNGLLDEKEFRAYLSELKLDDKVQAKILATYDTNGDKTIEFEEFLLAAEHFKHVVMAGVMSDASDLSTYYQLGCACCLCTLGMSWIPFYVKQRAMEERARSGRYVQKDVQSLKTPKPADNKTMDFQPQPVQPQPSLANAVAVGTQPQSQQLAAPVQPAALR